MDVSSTVDLQGARRFDEVLGPRSQRYFGEGYRRTRYTMGRFEELPDAEPRRVASVAQVAYPSDWSVKDGVDRRPHLSSVDALVLGTSAAQHALQAFGGLDKQQIRWAWFSDLTIRAGARPTIDLDGVPVQCDVESHEQSEDGGSTVLRLKIGTFTVAARVRHPTAPPESSAVSGSDSELYTSLFRTTEHRSWITRVDADPPRMECVNEVVADLDPGRTAGIEAAYGPQPTLIDSLVLAGQMLQILIATADGRPRESSGNLWMRRVAFEARTPWKPAHSRSGLTIVGRQELSRAGSMLHGIDVRCDDVCGVDIMAQLAYSEEPG